MRHWWLVLPLLYPAVSSGYQKDMTVTVEAGRTDCLYQRANSTDFIDIEYQVIDGSHGELDISFQLSDPLGRVLVADYKKPENSHRHQAQLEGDYRFCFDNTFSTFSRKTVFFDLMIDPETDDSATDYDEEAVEAELIGSASYGMRVHDISESVTRVRDAVARARRLQESLLAHEARDRNLAEETNASVQRWSFFQMVLMMLIYVMQVMFIRSLFEERPFNSVLQHVPDSVRRRLEH